jgi:hypothetical protein
VLPLKNASDDGSSFKISIATLIATASVLPIYAYEKSWELAETIVCEALMYELLDYESMLSPSAVFRMPPRQVRSLDQASLAECGQLPEVMRQVSRGYDCGCWTEASWTE